MKLIVILFACSALAVGPWALFASTSDKQVETVPLNMIPGISAEVLRAQSKLVDIQDPVVKIGAENTYHFCVQIRDRRGFGEEVEYDFVGDPESLNHFIREVEFVNGEHGTAKEMAKQFGSGAVDDVTNLVGSLVTAVLHPINTVSGLWNGGAALLGYAGDCISGKANPYVDAREFAQAYVENVRMEVAEPYGLNYRELKTLDARNSVESLAHARIGGAATVEVGLLFVAWAKVGKAGVVADAAANASRIGKVAEAGEAAKVARLGSLFRLLGRAELGVARTARFAQAEQKMSNLEILSHLLSPRKVGTITNPHALNGRLHKIMFFLRREELAGHNPEEALRRAMKMSHTAKPIPALYLDPALDEAQLLSNYEKAKQMGVFNDPENLAKMSHGQAPWVRTNDGIKQLHVDHMVPHSRVPELANSWGNLRYELQDVNQMRGNKIDQVAVSTLEKYHHNGFITAQQLAATGAQQ